MKKKSALQVTYIVARRIAVAVIGTTVLLTGIAMIVIPGPSTVVIPAGLAILSLEFAWARRWLKRIKKEIQAIQAKLSEQIAGQRHRQQATGREEHYNEMSKTRVQALEAVLTERFAEHSRRYFDPVTHKLSHWLKRVKERIQAIPAALAEWLARHKRRYNGTSRDERNERPKGYGNLLRRKDG